MTSVVLIYHTIQSTTDTLNIISYPTMRLSASIALTLLAYHQLSATSDAFNQKTNRKRSASAMARMLQKAESKAAGGGGQGNSNKNGGGGNGVTKKSGPNDRAKKFSDNGVHSAHLDANNSGITLDAVEYTYGAPILADFELTNDRISSDTLATLDLDTMGEWTMGVFMRMADPQGGALKPITSVTPTISEAGVRKLKEMVKRERKLRGLQEPAAEEGATTGTQPTVEGDATTTTPAPPETETVDPPTFNHVGSATIAATDASTLDPNVHGTGFDIYLLNEHGAAIIGPATFYMIPTADMVETQNGKGNKPSKNHPLAKFDHSSKKKKNFGNSGKSKVQGGPPTAKGMGYGSGTDGGLVIGTTESLADYALMTNQEYYTVGDTVSVSYDLSPETILEGARRMLQGNGNGNGSDPMGRNNNSGSNPPDATTTIPPIPGDEDTTTTTTTTAPEDTAEPGMPSTPDDWDGELEGATVPDPEPTIDGADITLFSMGVYMRMAHPQRGSLTPILSIPFCEDTEGCGGKVPEELESGEFTFSSNDLDVKGNGHGFDVWILNGLGVGVAGPYTFYVSE